MRGLPRHRRARMAAGRAAALRPRFLLLVVTAGQAAGRVDVAPRGDALVLQFRARGTAQEQHIRLTSTRCTFGFRSWFRCNGCARRAAKLYLGHGDTAFACRACHDLAYASQSETPAHRAITKAQKLRVRLGGSPSLLDPLPRRPPRMHRRTYYRLAGKAIAAQERLLGLEIEAIRRRFPGLASEQNGFPPARDASGRTKRSEKFFTPRAVAAWNAAAGMYPPREG
jgi:hypothetical protein